MGLFMMPLTLICDYASCTFQIRVLEMLWILQSKTLALLPECWKHECSSNTSRNQNPKSHVSFLNMLWISCSRSILLHFDFRGNLNFFISTNRTSKNNLLHLKLSILYLSDFNKPSTTTYPCQNDLFQGSATITKECLQEGYF